MSDRGWPEENGGRESYLQDIVMSFSDDNIRRLIQQNIEEEGKVDLGLKNAEADLVKLNETLSQRESSESERLQKRKEITMSIQLNRGIWNGNKKILENTMELNLISDRIADAKTDLRSVGHWINYDIALKDFEGELRHEEEQRQIQEAEASCLGQELARARCELSKSESQIRSNESKFGIEDEQKIEIVKLESIKALADDDIETLTNESLKGKEVYRSIKENFEQAEKEMKIMLKKKEAQKIRMKKRILELEEYLRLGDDEAK